MEATENEMTPIQGLQVITEIIAKTKENLSTHSYALLLWGWLIAAASLLFFMLHAYTSFMLYFLPFPMLILIGMILTMRYYTCESGARKNYIVLTFKADLSGVPTWNNNVYG